MQEAFQKITKNQLWDFFAKYDKLSPIQKKIWGRARWYCLKYPNARPTQTKIANGIPCSRCWVNRTLALFQSYGWMTLISNGARRAKTIAIQDFLLSVDLAKREYFRRIELTAGLTHSYSSKLKNTSKGSAGSFCAKREPPPIKIAPHLEKLKNLPLDAKLKLSLLPEAYLQRALETAKYWHSNGKKFDDEVKYVVGTALKMAQKDKFPINWRSYYAYKRKNR